LTRFGSRELTDILPLARTEERVPVVIQSCTVVGGVRERRFGGKTVLRVGRVGSLEEANVGVLDLVDFGSADLPLPGSQVPECGVLGGEGGVAEEGEEREVPAGATSQG
jgi:hypothetical protein